MPDLAEAPMNGLRSEDHLAAVHVSQGLHAQADPQDWRSLSLLQQGVAYACTVAVRLGDEHVNNLSNGLDPSYEACALNNALVTWGLVLQHVTCECVTECTGNSGRSHQAPCVLFITL